MLNQDGTFNVEKISDTLLFLESLLSGIEGVQHLIQEKPQHRAALDDLQAEFLTRIANLVYDLSPEQEVEF